MKLSTKLLRVHLELEGFKASSAVSRAVRLGAKNPKIGHRLWIERMLPWIKLFNVIHL